MISADRHRVRAVIVGAIDQDAAHAALAHLGERDLGRAVGRHARSSRRSGWEGKLLGIGGAVLLGVGARPRPWGMGGCGARPCQARWARSSEAQETTRTRAGRSVTRALQSSGMMWPVQNLTARTPMPPLLDPDVADLAPDGPTLTVYDEEHAGHASAYPGC
jgi:hypothetical protein